MNSLNIESIYLSIKEISESLPSVSAEAAAAVPLDSNELSKQLENLSIHNQDSSNGKAYLQDDGAFNINCNISTNNFYSTTSVKEMSNCSASCSHSSVNIGLHDLPRTSKRFRPHLFRRLEAGIPRKSLDISSIRKKTPAKPPRQRATSFGSLQLSHGKFGAVCRKMFGQQRRRKSFSMSSKSSSFDSDIADPMISTATEEEGGQSSTQSNNNGIQQQKGCSHEATSPEVPNYPIIENGEVDELAEYFEHFVNVHRKMSELAESMYV